MSRSPYFIHAGAPKAGSTWLYAALSEHPEIYLPPGKELQFFDKHYRLGERWYGRQFAGAPEGALAGDISPEYLFAPEAARRIAAYAPGMKILITLREPVSRLLSWRQQRRSLGERVEPPEAWLADEARLQRHRYLPALERIYAAFPRGQVHVDFHEDLIADPQAFLDAVCGFIGAPAFTPSILHQRVWSAREARNPGLMRIAYAGGQTLRALGLARLVGHIGTHSWFTRLAYSEVEPDQPGPEARRRAQAFFAQDNDALEALTGRSLPPRWRGGA